jgi:uncharacterized protein (DUF433 family)
LPFTARDVIIVLQEKVLDWIFMKGTVTKSIRIPKETVEEIERAARGRDFSSAANELLSEALKMRRCPGILFADGPTGRRARIAGTGLDVWEVIAGYRGVGENVKRVRVAYPQLDEIKLRAALSYYECYPGEIDERISENEALTPESVAARYPFTRPPQGNRGRRARKGE